MELKTLQGLVRAEPTEVGAERRGCQSFSAARRANIRCSWIPASWFPTDSRSARWSRRWPANNINAGGGFIERGAASAERARRRSDAEHRRHRCDRRQSGERYSGARARSGVGGASAQGAPGPTRQDHPHEDGTVINDDDVVEGIVLLRKGAEADATLDALHAEDRGTEQRLLPKGVKLVPHLDRSDLVHYTTHTVLRNLTDGVLLVTLILFLFLETSAAR